MHVTSPNPVRNEELMAALRRVLHRPGAPPTPALLVRVGAALLRTDPALALTGRRCVPTRLQASGFEFRFPDLVPALEDLLATEPRAVGTSRFTTPFCRTPASKLVPKSGSRAGPGGSGEGRGQAGCHDGFVDDRGYRVDRLTQCWVRATGDRVRVSEHPWLAGPIGEPGQIGDGWVQREADRLGARVDEGGGLVTDFASLAGDGFDPGLLAPPVIDFYENTSRWRLEVWSQWSPMAWPFGWLLGAVFARRLRQLSLPLRPLDAARGMDSRVLRVTDRDGAHLGSAWLRTLRATGQTVYSGWYGTTLLPGAARRSIRVVFPLPRGSISVFLRPENAPGGGLRLSSPLGNFGDDGAYLLVGSSNGLKAWVRRAPIPETFDVYVDEDGVLRADHALHLWTLPVVRFHYRIEKRVG